MPCGPATNPASISAFTMGSSEVRALIPFTVLMLSESTWPPLTSPANRAPTYGQTASSAVQVRAVRPPRST